MHQNFVCLDRVFDFEMHASYWLNIPSKCCVVPWYNTATSVVGTLPLESRCGRYLSGRYLSGRYHWYTMVFCTMRRTLWSNSSPRLLRSRVDDSWSCSWHRRVFLNPSIYNIVIPSRDNLHTAFDFIRFSVAEGICDTTRWSSGRRSNSKPLQSSRIYLPKYVWKFGSLRLAALKLSKSTSISCLDALLRTLTSMTILRPKIEKE